MKITVSVHLVADFDETISITEFDNLLKSKLEERGLDLALPLGYGDYVLTFKDKISDK